MIGNLDYIIDIVSEKYGIDRRIIEVVAQESFKGLKKQMTNSEATSLYYPEIGYFITNNSRLRNYIRQYIKKARKIRLAKKKHSPEDSMYKMLSEKEEICLERIRVAWKQLDALRILMTKEAARRQKYYNKVIEYKKANGIPVN